MAGKEAQAAAPFHACISAGQDRVRNGGVHNEQARITMSCVELQVWPVGVSGVGGSSGAGVIVKRRDT